MLTPERYEKQKNELEVIKSIYDKEVKAFKIQDCWKRPSPLELTIKLKPSFDKVGLFSSIDLNLVCSNEYPDKPPKIYLQNPIGLSLKNVEELKKKLIIKANELIGIEMIYELCQVAQEFLLQHNHKPVASEHENMLKLNAEKEIEKERLKLDFENREKAEIAEENEHRLAEKLKQKDNEGVERKLRFLMINPSDLGEYEMIELLNPLIGKGEKKRIYKFIKNKFFRPSLHKMATDCDAWDQTNLILMTKWRFEYTIGRKNQRKSNHKTIDFTEFEQKLDLFVKIANQKLYTLRTDDQEFFSSYLFVNLKKISTVNNNFNCELLIGQSVNSDDKCLGLQEAFNEIREKPHKYGPQIATQIVCALKWLHSQDFYHGYLQRSTLWFTNKQIFRLSDFYLLPKLFELCDNFEQLISVNSSQRPIVQHLEDTIKKNQLRDLFNLGVLLDSILEIDKSSLVNQQNENNENVNVANFILACQKAKSVEELLDHNYLIHDLTRAFSDFNSETDSKLKISSITVSNRLTKDFNVLKYLGKGGFGDVYLARNKLDDNNYAIKRIPLNPKSNTLNSKIKREANLFSKLNHEHIVRYYAAWIESTVIADNNQTKSFNDNKSLDLKELSNETDFETNKMLSNKNESDENISKESNDDSISSSSNSSSSDSKNYTNKVGRLWRRCNKSSSKKDESSSSDDNINFKTLFSQHTIGHQISTAGHSEFDVIFSNETVEWDETDDKKDLDDKISNEILSMSKNLKDKTEIKLQQILYIQMEYCSNSTLRSLIDSGRLYTNTSLIWRIFGEVLSALQYIHQQNMIHRDIKPMNIFLDNNWSVTTRDLYTVEPIVENNGDKKLNNIKIKNFGFGTGGVEITKDIGTAMYNAPEIQKNSSTIYSSKADVYSAGIVLFEMFLQPPKTGSERYYNLQALRDKLEFPSDFGQEIQKDQKLIAEKIILWTLKKDPDERPSVDEILQSKKIPLIDYGAIEFQKFFVQTLNNRKSQLYKWLLTTIFNQNISPALNYCFDQQTCLVIIFYDYFNSFERQSIIERIKRELNQIFYLNAFVYFSTQLLLPFGLNENTIDENLNKITVAGGQTHYSMIDSTGMLIMLPTNLRQSFIRYCARNGISKLKRFTFDKVFAQSSTFGAVHPLERYECCADIIESINSRYFIAAETILLSSEVIKKLTPFEGLKSILIIGHIKLVKATCLHLGIKDDATQNNVFETLYHFSSINKTLKNEEKFEFLMNRCGLTNQSASSLLKILEFSKNFESFTEQLRSLTRSKSEKVRDLTRNALNDLTETLAALRCLNGGIKYENLLFDGTLCYRPQIFNNGLVYLFKLNLVRQNKTNIVTVLAGGSFESSINAERRSQDPLPESAICAYGFNLMLDNVAQFYRVRKLENVDGTLCSVLIFSISDDLNKNKYDLAHKFRDFGLATEVFHETNFSIDYVLEYCKKNKIHFLLMLMESDDVILYANESFLNSLSQFPSSYSTIFSTKNSLMNYRIGQNQYTCEQAIRIIYAYEMENFLINPQSLSNSNLFLYKNSATLSNFNENLQSSNFLNNCENLSLCENSVISNFTISSATIAANININYVMDDKPAYSYKKKTESNIRNMLSSDLLSKLSVKTRIEVFISELQPDSLRLLSAYLDRHYDTIAMFRSTVDSFLKLYKIIGRQKVLVETLCSFLQSFCCGQTSQVISNCSNININNINSLQLNENNPGLNLSHNNSSSSSTMFTSSPILVLCCKNISNFYRVLL